MILKAKQYIYNFYFSPITKNVYVHIVAPGYFIPGLKKHFLTRYPNQPSNYNIIVIPSDLNRTYYPSLSSFYLDTIKTSYSLPEEVLDIYIKAWKTKL